MSGSQFPVGKLVGLGELYPVQTVWTKCVSIPCREVGWFGEGRRQPCTGCLYGLNSLSGSWLVWGEHTRRKRKVGNHVSIPCREVGWFGGHHGENSMNPTHVSIPCREVGWFGENCRETLPESPTTSQFPVGKLVGLGKTPLMRSGHGSKRLNSLSGSWLVWGYRLSYPSIKMARVSIPCREVGWFGEFKNFCFSAIKTVSIPCREVGWFGADYQYANDGTTDKSQFPVGKLVGLG